MKVKFILFVLLVTFSFTGCETFKGLAKDIENTGNNLYEVFDRVKVDKE